MSKRKTTQHDGINNMPEHLKHWPGLYVRKGERIVEAPVDDQTVAQSYPRWPNKGPILDGKRLTIMTKKNTYQVGEEIRVLHVLEVVEAGHQLYVMGPKPIFGEYLDDQLVTQAPTEGEDPLIPQFYNGRVVPSPAVDFNYEITSYSFSAPGKHKIYWKLNSLQSNTLVFEIVRRNKER